MGEQPATEQCQMVLRGYEPFDAERGRHEEPRDVPCVAEAGHAGYHTGADGLPFGPWRGAK